MKRKIILSILASLMLICLGFCLVGCNKHAHTYGDWVFDETNHWKECTGAEGECDAPKIDNAKHTFDSESGKCTVCQYQQGATLSYTEITENGNIVAYSVSGLDTKDATFVSIPVRHNGKPVTSIASSAFSGCTGLTSVTLPDSVISIGSMAFSHCISLTSITIPKSVTNIGADAFNDCYKLIEVYNLCTLKITEESELNGKVGYYAKDIYTSKNTPSKLSTTEDGFVFYEDDEDVYLMGYEGKETNLVLPENFKNKEYSLYEYAFYNANITNVTIPEKVAYINEAAFSTCVKLKSVTISNGVHFISDRTFEGCESLTSITLPTSVTTIGDLAFAGCEGLKDVTMSNIVTSIGDDAFGGCVALTNITLSNSLVSIGDKAFCNCTGLTSITIPKNVTSIGEGAFSGCKGLTSVTFNDTENWQVSNGSTTENVALTDASANVKFLTETYSEKYTWKKEA